MGQSAARLNGAEPSSILRLESVISTLDDYLSIIGSITDNLPNSFAMETMKDFIEIFVEDLTKMRKELKTDGERCKELHREIMTIEEEFEDKEVPELFSLFVMALREFERDINDDEKKKALKSRRLFRKHIKDFRDRLRQSVNTRCAPESRQAS